MTLWITLSVLAILAGLVGLYFGGNILVDGASKLAKRLGVSALVIGLTIVGFGTSSPELAVSLLSAISGNAGISLGNVIGSNIFNTFFILGVASLFAVISNEKRPFLKDGLFMLAAYAITGIFIFLPLLTKERGIDVLEGALMILAIAAYIVYLFIAMRKNDSRPKIDRALETEPENDNAKKETIPVSILKIVGGIAILVVASEFLIRGSVYIAENVLHVSERFIGLTVAAVGTSLPELVTSIVAARKKEMDISVGNIIGSNIFNMLFIAGIAAAITPVQGALFMPVSPAIVIDYAVMAASGLLLVGFLTFSKKLGKRFGISFIALYALYFVYLLMSAKV